MKFIPTRVHGVLDYLSGIALLVAPRYLGWPPHIVQALTFVGIGTLAYSILTQYELGLVRLLPFGAHLALDLMSAIGFIAAGLLLQGEPQMVRTALIGFGVFELLAVLFSQTSPSHARDHGHMRPSH